MASLACTPSTFSPTLFGADILSVQASLVSNYSASVPAAYRLTAPSIEVRNLIFCNVTVTYTHPGTDDSVNVEAWLPTENWNDRLVAVGGAGWAAGRYVVGYSAMAGAAAEGYATITSDAGLGSAIDTAPWALLSPGNVDLYKLQNLASVSLNDEAVIGKSLVKSFYGTGPAYSYWNGCSQGGRQGLMLAQRYPSAYDGLAVGAPAIYWTEVVTSIFWPQQYMNMLGAHPRSCELDAITAAAVSACDGLDGVADAIIGDVAACRAAFDPFALVGTRVPCEGRDIAISAAAAAVANATWSGAASAGGRRLAPGLNIGADLTGASGSGGTATTTNCTGNDDSYTCVGAPNFLGTQWFSLFVAKVPDFAYGNLTHAQFDRLVRESAQQYTSLIGTGDADLTEFRDAGGKIVMFHGLADQMVPTKISETYHAAVVSATAPDEDGDEGVDAFYRYFPVPGLGHCLGGNGPQPTALFAQLRAWVENGTAPDSSPVSYRNARDNSTQLDTVLCPYPRRATLDAQCGDAAKSECWVCEGSTEDKRRFDKQGVR
ncbi:Tannase/feruloyl esterase [Biscogniauxia mediterranea]|nr:Tannase/feruloyl esterase [Biscogniauxia mediterranea]